MGITLAKPPADLAATIKGFQTEYNTLRKPESESGIVPAQFYRIMGNRGGSSRADDDTNECSIAQSVF